MVKGPLILFFAKGMPSKMETCKRIFNDIPLSSLSSANKKPCKNYDVDHTYLHIYYYPFRNIS